MISQATSASFRHLSKAAKALLFAAALLALPGVQADEGKTAAAAAKIEATAVPTTHRAVILKSYPMGITKYELDHATQVTGWQVADRWYFGRARGDDSGLALIWQPKASQQMSLSSDGVRFTHRF